MSHEADRPDIPPVPPPPPPPPTSVSVQFTTSASAQLFAGVPFTVQGTATSIPAGNVTGVSLTLDGAAVSVVDDSTSNNWSSWQAVITPAATGAHTLAAEASGLGKTGSASLQLSAAPVLSCVAPVPSAGVITASEVSLAVQIQVATPAFSVASSSWQYQLSGGSWAAPVAVSQPSASTWQFHIAVPATAVGPGGTSYPLQIRATTPTAPVLSATLALTLQAVDTTAPELLSLTVPAYAVAGSTPAVFVRATDEVPGAIFSGIPAGGVTVQLDGQQCPVTQTASGDPSSWSSALPAITNAVHQVTVTVKDAVGNTTTATQPIQVELTSWTRLEPIPRDPTLMEGLQARIADPAWLLARQVAFGEFTGQDAASAVSVRLRATASSLTRFRPAYAPGSATPASGPGQLLPADSGPLEVLAEAEPEPQTGGAARPVFAAQAGLQYLRMLAAAGVGSLGAYEQGLLQAYPIPPPAPTAQAGVPPAPSADDPALLPYCGRAPDGERLYADLVAALQPPGAGSLPAAPALGGANAAAVTSVAQAWLTWYEAVSSQELGCQDTWVPERLEYAFSVAAPGPDAETVLAAAEMDTGELDWLDFDLLASAEVTPASPSVSLGAVPSDLPGGDTSIVFVGLPTPVTFRGMPNQRWWDFEDASVDFGAISAPVESLTTSVVIEFAMRYGNDHFIIPLPLAVGSVLGVDSLVVTDTFGEVLQVRSVAAVDSATGPFRLFEHTVPPAASGPPARDPLFVLFPTAGVVIRGPALEEVHFVRDEAAEIVWGIEQTALGPDGLPVDRTADALAQFLALTPTPNDPTALPVRSYLLRTDVEANWFPFLMPGAAGSQLAMADVPPLDPSQPTPLPWGRILAPFAPAAAPGQPLAPGLLMPLEEITRVGAQVTRSWRYARWVDGRQLAWVGRNVRPGRGPGSSGLSFDLAL
jgi:hypothetical protein